jgi:hypothetical protein
MRTNILATFDFNSLEICHWFVSLRNRAPVNSLKENSNSSKELLEEAYQNICCSRSYMRINQETPSHQLTRAVLYTKGSRGLFQEIFN